MKSLRLLFSMTLLLSFTSPAYGDQFAMSLHKELQNDSNLAFSPFSIKSVFFLAYIGARGDTATELTKVFDFTSDTQQLVRADTLTQGVMFQTANGLFVDQRFAISEDYIQKVSGLGASVDRLDFLQQPEKSRSAINEWVSQRTERMIPELLRPPFPTSDTTLVLANALYFKGKWRDAFDKKRTRQGVFQVEKNSAVEANYMFDTRTVKYFSSDDYQAVALPYLDEKYTMYFVLPSHSLGELHKQLGADLLVQLREKTSLQRVSLQIPRFFVRKRMSLKDSLFHLGLSAPFEPRRADFSGMDPSRTLFVADAIHETVIEVNEEGTEAAATTALSLERAMAPAPPLEFHLTKPFFFALVNEEVGVPIVMGEVHNPALN